MEDTLTLGRDRETNTQAVTEREARLFLGAWAGRRTPYPNDCGLAALFAEQVALRPDAVALAAGSDPKERQMTYGALDALSAALAERLVAAGVTRSAPVALAVERSIEMVVGMLAVLRAGGGYVPLDADYPAERLAWMLADVAPRVLLVDAPSLARLAVPEGITVVRVDEAMVADAGAAGERPVPAEEAQSGPDDLAYITYTSGSTGIPKGVAVPQRAVARLVRETDCAELGPDETLLQLAATSFDATTFEVWGPLLTGGRLVLFRPGPPALDELERVVARQRVTLLWITTGLFHRLVEERPESMATTRHVMTGGDVISPGRCRQALETCPGITLTACYGPTENTTFSTFDPMATASAVEEPVTIGRPIANSTVYVADAALRLVPVGTAGELLVGGDGLAWGYWRRPGLTAARFVPNPFAERPGERLYHTGDLVRWRPDSRLDFLGRNDHQVKIRGFRIEPGEVEKALAEHPAVSEVVVLPREVAGAKALVAYFVAEGDRRDGPDRLDSRELRSFLDGRLPEYMHPTAFVVLERFPLTRNGKIDRRALPEPTAEHRLEAGGYVEPAEGLERDLAAVWAEVLELPRVGAEDDFFALGGHSLLATRIATRLRTTVGLEVPFRTLLEARTVRTLAERLAEGGDGCGAARPLETIPRAERRQGPDGDVLPASAAQRRLWLLHEAEPALCAYNIPFAYEITGGADARLDPVALEAALCAVVERHEALRTTFAAEDGAPVQVIRPASWVSRVLSIERADLSALDPAAAGAEVARLRIEEERRPFDLASGPLLRSQLLRLPPAGDGERWRYAWLLTIHHIVFDGWSVSLLLDDLGAEYRARCAGQTRSVPPARLQYADYTAWEDALYQGPELERHLRFWRDLLGDAPEPVRLPTDRPRQGRRGFRGSTVAADLPPDAVARLAAAAATEGATLFMALVAVWQLLLHRITGQDEILVASAVAGRQRREAESLIGFFANYLLLPGDFADDPTFRELLDRVRRTTADAMEHQVPFDLLVRDLRPEREGAGLDAIAFAMDTTRLTDPELAPGIAFTPVEHRPETSKTEVALLMDRQADRARLEYNADLFDRATAQVWVDLFAAALAGAAEHPDRPVSEIPLVPAAGRGEAALRPLAEGWMGGPAEVPRDVGLGALFEAVAAARGGATALSAADGDVTYRDLDRRANRIARALARLGVVRGTRVALALERSADLIAATLGVIKAGGAYVPLDARYPAERIAAMVKDAGVEALVGTSSLVEGFGTAVAGFPALVLDHPEGREALASAPETPPPVATCGDDLAYVMFTSGSTGRPKGAAIPHRAIVHLVLGTDFAQLGPEQTFLQLASVAFDAATFEIWGALLNGGRLFLPPAGTPAVSEIGRWLVEGDVDIVLLTTGLFHQVAEEAVDALASVELLFVGGDVASPAHFRRVLERHPEMTVYNVYGPTENACYTTCHALGGTPRTPAVPEPLPIGRPIAGTQVFVVDRALRAVPETVPGELMTGGDGLAWGYFNRPALTAERFVPDPFAHLPGGRPGGRLYRTGDLARWRTDGTLDFLGRTDTQVKIRGFRIEIGEIEGALASHPAIADAVVVAREVAGQKALVAYVVSAAEEAPDASALRDHLAERVAAFMVPSAFVVLDRLPLTTNGKVDRRRLPAPSDEDRLAGSGYVEPATAAERRVAALWAEVLDLERVGAEDDFFHLGGHSLLATRVVARLRSEDGVDLSMNRLFEASTVRRFAAVVAAAQAGSPGTGQEDGEKATPAVMKKARRRVIRRNR